MNIKSFFVTTLSQALDLGLATCEDVTKYVTPDVLAQYLPRPLWARLLTAALGAPKVDATLVVETIGVPNLCEHVPAAIIWACILDIGGRALGNQPLSAPRAVSVSTLASPLAVAPPPPEKPRAQTPPRGTQPVGPSIPAPAQAMTDLFNELEEEDKVIPPPAPSTSPAGRARRPSQDRFRPSNTGIGRLANQSGRRPTPSVPAPATVDASTQRPRRGQTEADQDIAQDVADWKPGASKEAIAVEDDQLVDWSSSEETVTSGDDYNRKR